MRLILIGKIVALIILLALSALFSGSETALFSLSKLRIRRLEERKRRGFEVVKRLLEDPHRLITTILIGNMVVNISASTIVTAIAIPLFGQKGVAVAIGVMIFLLLIFGEITPKTYAVQNAETISLLVARPLEIFSIIILPLRRALESVSDLFLPLFRSKYPPRVPSVTEDEIKTMVTVGEREGVLGEEEKEMIHSIFKFTDTRAFETMIPRTDMVCLEADATVGEALDFIRKTGHSRIPVYQGRVDNMVGIIYAKDILSHFKKENYQLKLRDLVRPPYFIPETKRVPSLLKEFQKRRIQMALVVNEYGGIEGLVTLEDLIEEIVGEIPPEYRKEKRLIERIDRHTLRVSGRLEIDEANRVLKLRLPENGFETIGGFIFNLIGRIPKEREEIKYKKLSFTIEKATPKRILYVRIEKR
ncbi:MAG TPA: HlyC/CorC family transporter [bacterium]|nr:HlyC/CorC family transporter [bacterium]